MKSLFLALLLTLLVILVPNSGFANDADQLVEQMQKEANRNGGNLVIGNVETRPDNTTVFEDFVFTDGKTGNRVFIERFVATDLLYPQNSARKNSIWPLAFSSAGFTNLRVETSRDNITTIEIPEMQLVNLEPIGSTGFSLDRFETGEISLISKVENGDEIKGTIDGISGENLLSPDLDVEGSKLLPENDLNIEIGAAEFELNGSPLAGWQRLGGKTVANDGNTRIASQGGLNGFFIDLSTVPVTRQNKQGIETIRQLGYEVLNMDITGEVSWDIVSGLVDLSSYRLDIQDVGVMDIALRISGYNEEVARRISAIGTQINQEKDPQKKQALSLQMLGDMASLSFEELELAIEDKSIVNRVIDLQAERSNLERENVASILPFLATTLLTPYNLPEFTNQLRDALSLFMQGNKTIRMSAKPDDPVLFSQFLALGAGVRAGSVQPAEIIDRLNLKVETE